MHSCGGPTSLARTLLVPVLTIPQVQGVSHCSFGLHFSGAWCCRTLLMGFMAVRFFCDVSLQVFCPFFFNWAVRLVSVSHGGSVFGVQVRCLS